MKHATGMETFTKIYFLFIFNLVKIRIRKTSPFWTSHSLQFDDVTVKTIYIYKATADSRSVQSFAVIH